MLICDKRRPRTRGDTNIRPPQGGRIKTAPPASGPRLGRSSAWGGTPPDPLGCAPWRAFAHRAPAASVIQPEGFRARVRRWRGWATACGCPCPTPSPWRFSGFWEISKSWAARSAAGGSGGVPPVVGRRWATRPRRWAARVQPQAVPAVHGLGEVVHGRPGSGRSGSSEQSNRANIFSFAQPTRAKPRQYWVSREPLYKKIGDPDCTTLCNLTTKMQSKQQLSTF